MDGSISSLDANNGSYKKHYSATLTHNVAITLLRSNRRRQSTTWRSRQHKLIERQTVELHGRSHVVR